MPDCEYRHAGLSECDGEATFILYRHNVQRLICRRAMQVCARDGGGLCFHPRCGRPRWTHWETSPLTTTGATA